MLVELQKLNKKEVNVVSSLDIAETFEKRHSDVLRSIESLECSKSFAERNFALSDYKDSTGKSNKMYYITRDGFTLLVMGYTGEKAMKFKEAYIQQFNEMEKMLQGKLIEREKGIVVRQTFTKILKESGENDRLHGHAYSLYTDVIYKSIFGKSAKQLREDFGIEKKDNLRDYFTQEDLAKVQNAEMLVGSLMAYGWGYDEIKDFITEQNKKLIA